LKKININVEELTNLVNKNFKNEELAKHFNCSISVIKNRIRDNNLLGLRHSNIVHQKYSANYEYFKIPNIENSYWAGFIAADGCIKTYKIGVPGQNRLYLGINEENHIDCFKNCIKYTGPIRKERKLTVIEISSDKLCNDLLNNFNITSKKSLTLLPPINLSLINSLAFIKGYSDGDGCINMHNDYVSWQIVGTQEILLWIQHTIQNYFNCTNKNTIIQVSNNNTYKYSIKGSKAIEILSFLHEELITPELNRKWYIVKEYNRVMGRTI
jgi:aspartate carbamoyltransferase regulatory subunit